MKEAQIIFLKTVNGDSILQLKDGSLLFYYFRSKYGISIYNEKSFQKIFAINILKAIKKYENDNVIGEDGKSKEEQDSNDQEDEDEEEYFERRRFMYEDSEDTKRKNSIKELSNGVILIGRDNYLIELKLKEKDYEVKIVNKLNDIILDINELPDHRITVITDNNIILFNQEKGEYNIKQQYPVKANWKIVAVSSTERFYGNFHQYYSSEILPNNRLLLNSFSTELSYNSGCGTHPPYEFSYSKIIFIDTKNFEEIKSTELFEIDAKHIVLDNVILIQDYKNLLIYDINSLELIKNTKLFERMHYMYRFDDKYFVTVSLDEERNDLLVYKNQNNDVIEYCGFRTKITFEKIIGWNHYPIRGYNDKFLFTLKDKRVIILCHNNLYALQLSLE